MADSVKHDYHLVNPSPWPLVGFVILIFAVTILRLGGNVAHRSF